MNRRDILKTLAGWALAPLLPKAAKASQLPADWPHCERCGKAASVLSVHQVNRPTMATNSAGEPLPGVVTIHCETHWHCAQCAPDDNPIGRCEIVLQDMQYLQSRTMTFKEMYRQCSLTPAQIRRHESQREARSCPHGAYRTRQMALRRRGDLSEWQV